MKMDAKPADGAKREFFPQLTSVRFFAAFMVVLYHYHKELSTSLPQTLQNILIHGYVGVSFFFLLSGFILAANYYDRFLNKSVAKSDFWFARFSRIYPVYILSIILFLPRFLLPTASDPQPELAVYSHQHLLQTILVPILGLQCWGFPAGAYLNSPTWSISTEIFFYVVLPFIIPGLNRIRTKWLWLAMFCTFILAGIGPYLYHSDFFPRYAPRVGITYDTDIDSFINQFIRANSIFRFPEFVVGVLSFRYYREVLSQGAGRSTFLVLSVLSIPFLLSLLFEPESTILKTVLYSGQFTSVPFFLLLILWLVSSRSAIVAGLKSPVWVLLGEASFSLYLFHIAIKNFGQLIATKVLHQSELGIPLSLLLIAVSVAISIPIFKYIETPSRRALTKWWKNRKSATNPA